MQTQQGLRLGWGPLSPIHLLVRVCGSQPSQGVACSCSVKTPWELMEAWRRWSPSAGGKVAPFCPQSSHLHAGGPCHELHKDLTGRERSRSPLTIFRYGSKKVCDWPKKERCDSHPSFLLSKSADFLPCGPGAAEPLHCVCACLHLTKDCAWTHTLRCRQAGGQMHSHHPPHTHLHIPIHSSTQPHTQPRTDTPL